MPVRTPPGALPAAYRVICLRSIRRLAFGERISEYEFGSESSKKCQRCTVQKGSCSFVSNSPLPVVSNTNLIGSGLRRRGVWALLRKALGLGGPTSWR